jgi:uncharacterized membrane protein HdeD (DUF308 family)
MREWGLTTHFHEVEEIRKNWGWFLALGLLLTILGGMVIQTSYVATVFSIMLFGALLTGAGIVQFIQSFLARKWSGLFLMLLLGLLYIVTGLFCLAKPATAAITLTFWIAAFCFIGGLFRMITSLVLRFRQWGWVFFNGLVTFILGAIIYADWPISGLWVIGLFIGVDMVLSGWSWILLSLTSRLTKE